MERINEKAGIERHRAELVFDLKDMKPNLSPRGELSIQVDVVTLDGPLMAAERIEQVARAFDLQPGDVETQLDRMFQNLEALNLAKQLVRRRKY